MEGDKVIFDLTEDAKGKPLFALGKADLTVDARKVLSLVAPKLNVPKGKLSVEGHTDAYTYAGERFTNWELSTDRASGARRELERAGVNPAGIAMVAGYAATKPFVADNPYDAAQPAHPPGAGDPAQAGRGQARQGRRQARRPRTTFSPSHSRPSPPRPLRPFPRTSGICWTARWIGSTMSRPKANSRNGKQRICS